jgi:hypothetical protein
MKTLTLPVLADAADRNEHQPQATSKPRSPAQIAASLAGNRKTQRRSENGPRLGNDRDDKNKVPSDTQKSRFYGQK